MTVTAAQARAEARKRGWMPAIRELVAQAPTPPADAVEMLRAAGFPAHIPDSVKPEKAAS